MKVLKKAFFLFRQNQNKRFFQVFAISALQIEKNFVTLPPF